jgi:hypothetical protein
MFFIKNFIIIIQYISFQLFGITNIKTISFDIKDNNDDKNDIPLCYCNLCWTISNINYLFTKELKTD